MAACSVPIPDGNDNLEHSFGVEGDFNGVWNDVTFSIGGLNRRKQILAAASASMLIRALLVDNWSRRRARVHGQLGWPVEYRYYDFSSETIDSLGATEITNNTVTVGVAYKF